MWLTKYICDENYISTVSLYSLLLYHVFSRIRDLLRMKNLRLLNTVTLWMMVPLS